MLARQEVLGQQRLQLQPMHQWCMRHAAPDEGADQDAYSGTDEGAYGCSYSGAYSDSYSCANEVPDYSSY